MSPFTSPVVVRSVGTVTAAGILSLLAAMPALAATDPFFTLHFGSNADSSTNGGYSGILGEATYTFSTTEVGKMTLSLKNLSGSPVTSSRLVSTGFNLPEAPPAAANVSFVSFTAVDPLKWNIIQGDNLSPFGTFDVCASINPPADCDASGPPNDGLAIGESTTVGTFTLANSSSTPWTASNYRDAFVAMYAPPTGGNAGAFNGNYFMRFKAIMPGDRSDKVWATSYATGGGVTPPPPPGPGDEVPGPLPLFGAAAAFGYSRKLRQRLKATTLIG